MSKQIHSRTNKKVVDRRRKKRRIRGTVFGVPGRPRLSIFKSARHIYAQIIDDTEGKTLAYASSVDKSLSKKKIGTKDVPSVVAKLLMERAKAKNIETIVFDRNGFLYHGNVKKFADALREGGLKF
ncbi:MAG: 50S ribosomal protein L18 [Deltaproteobacteria bacterium RIFCSPHIGHO2_12_FULL_43_9]|nr:MAG: 50S ribosomal protein L18 [Deltaproteobacteria bacterium RIFCSPHIGHO2_12_FULL_43_9]